MIEYVNRSGITTAIVTGSISGVNDALDMMAEVFFGGCERMIINKESLPDGFFTLSTGIAGEILQKFSNYRMKLAIVGDFNSLKSKSLADFIYECNKGSLVFFKSTLDEAIEALT